MNPLPDVATSEPLEPFAVVQLQAVCDPTEKPGTAAFRAWLRAQRGGRDLGILRACEKGKVSEHKEGRAWDWGMDASNPDEAARVADTLAWLLAPDSDGNPAALFRRLGLQYVIWNRNVWSTRTKSWVPYTGSSPHTDHVHFSFGWPGAMAQTSFFRWLGTKPAPIPSFPSTQAPPGSPLPSPSPPPAIDDGDEPSWPTAARHIAAFGVGLSAGVVLVWSILTITSRRRG